LSTTKKEKAQRLLVNGEVKGKSVVPGKSQSKGLDLIECMGANQIGAGLSMLPIIS